jgi:NAD(P)-dependent dehydrogenase (short-subunit alcohol dehydrogenase family)
MRSCLDLKDRVAVVIGATSGLGRATAVGFAQHGAAVVPTGRRRQHIEELCREIETGGGRALCQLSDVRSRESIDALRDAAIEGFGRVDILVNAAGYTFRQPTVEVCEEQWSALLDTHVTGTLRACQSFHAALRESGHGRIINIASLASFVAFHEVAAYYAAKSAIAALTRSLACEWAKDGISVNAIAPGVIPTEMNTHIVNGTPRGREMLMRTPMARFGRAEEMVGLAVLLASDGASFLTGQVIAVDGGYLASGVNS